MLSLPPSYDLTSSLSPPRFQRISREFLLDGYTASKKGLPVLPPLSLWWPGGAATRAWGGTFACLPLRRPAWTACTRNIPYLQEDQPGWWKVGSLKAWNQLYILYQYNIWSADFDSTLHPVRVHSIEQHHVIYVNNVCITFPSLEICRLIYCSLCVLELEWPRRE